MDLPRTALLRQSTGKQWRGEEQERKGDTLDSKGVEMLGIGKEMTSLAQAENAEFGTGKALR